MSLYFGLLLGHRKQYRDVTMGFRGCEEHFSLILGFNWPDNLIGKGGETFLRGG